MSTSTVMQATFDTAPTAQDEAAARDQWASLVVQYDGDGSVDYARYFRASQVAIELGVVMRELVAKDEYWAGAAARARGAVRGMATTMTTPKTTAAAVSARSVFDPVYVGIDEFGHPVHISMIYRNILIGGEPNAGKSAMVNNLVAHAALSTDCRLCLIDGKQVELGQWEQCADVFVGPDVARAITTLRRLQAVMDNRYTFLRKQGRRKIARGDAVAPILVAIDEIAYFSATVGDRKTQDAFSATLRDLVARGRAVGIMVVAATQRPSSDIIPTSLRDLFAWRFAGRCTTDVSSDIVLGHGWASRGWSSNEIDPNNPGAGLLIAEGRGAAAGEDGVSVR